jgi:hypothetical protein
MVGGRWPSMVRNGPFVGTVWARCGHGGYAYQAGVLWLTHPARSGGVTPAVCCLRGLAPVWGTPTLSLACRAELQEVGPAPLRTVSGRASRCLRRRHVLGRGDVRDARSPGTSGGMAPGQGVGDPQKRVAVRRQMHVAKRLWSVEAAEFLDEHLTVALIAPLARLDDQSLHSAVEKRVDHATEALGADVGIAALAVEGQRRQLAAAYNCVEDLPAAAVALGHEVPPPLPGQAERPNEPA